jgi:hypothetical protein
VVNGHKLRTMGERYLWRDQGGDLRKLLVPLQHVSLPVTYCVLESWPGPRLGTIGRSQVAGCPTRRLHRPCRARPADRSLVAEDRSAAGVRDHTGPEPPMLTRLLTGRATTPRDERVQDGTRLLRPASSTAW